MEEQGEFFTKKQKQLLSFALWAKYLAWVVLIVYILWTGSAYLQAMNSYTSSGWAGLNAPAFGTYLSDNFPIALDLFLKMAGIFLKGIVYYFVLQGLSLGLNMIVETDVNYRQVGEADK